MAYVLYKLWKGRANRRRELGEQDVSIGQKGDSHLEPPNAAQPSRGDDPSTHELSSLKQAASKSQNQTIPEDAGTGPAIPGSGGKGGSRYRWKLVLGLFLPFSVQALDLTIIAGALPFIASDFNQLSQLNWIISAFNLTSATFIPAWGQFADVFGRYAALQTALVVVLVGSALCAGAPVTAFPMLLVGRALQGVGCAGLMIVTKVILADKVSLRENAKNNTIFALVGGLGYGLGPVIGGYLTQANWRWCFIINIPIGCLGLVLVHFLLRSELLGPRPITRSDGVQESHEISSTFSAKLATIDFVGQFLFLFGMGLLVLALTWAGSSYSWADVKIIAPLAVGCVLMAGFLVWEYFMVPGSKLAVRYPYRKAMIPLKLLVKRNAGLLIYLNFVTGMAMYAVFYFVDLYFVLVLNYTSGEAGRNLLYYVPGIGIGSYLAMFACTIYPRQTWFPLAFGTFIEPLGLTILAVALRGSSLPTIYGMLALTGVGTGIRFMPGTLHGVGYFPTQIASIVSSMSLALALGGTFATTVMINVFNNNISKSGFSFSSTGSSLDAISALPPIAQSLVREQSKNSIALSFFAVSAFMWLGVLAACGLGNVDVSDHGKEEGVEGEERTSGQLVKGSYIGSLFRRH